MELLDDCGVCPALGENESDGDVNELNSLRLKGGPTPHQRLGPMWVSWFSYFWAYAYEGRMRV